MVNNSGFTGQGRAIESRQERIRPQGLYRSRHAWHVIYMKNVALWQFNLATFLVTQLVLGVEGWSIWGISALCAWLINRDRPIGQKNYRAAGGLWLFLLFLMRI